MKKHLKIAMIMLVAAFVAAQLLRPNRTNPVTNPSHALQAQPETSAALPAVINRSCRDCHTNDTVWPRAANVAPLSWLMSYAVTRGRETVNFSEWSGYTPDVRQALLDASCKDVTAGKMPSIYTWVRPEARLSADDIATICAAATRSQAEMRRDR